LSICKQIAVGIPEPVLGHQKTHYFLSTKVSIHGVSPETVILSPVVRVLDQIALPSPQLRINLRSR